MEINNPYDNQLRLALHSLMVQRTTNVSETGYKLMPQPSTHINELKL